ncbi:MAG: hypothetical protein JWR79_1970 [Tardiphaga sp.]|nr:hypothetical protein [Tardiphaga sp.]
MNKRRATTTLKSTTVLGRTDDKAMPVAIVKRKRSKTPLLVADPVVPSPGPDPLDAVSSVLAAPPSETVLAARSKESPDQIASARSLETTVKPTAWDYPAKAIEFSHDSAMCTFNFVQRYAVASTPQAIIAVTTDLYKEQGRLFRRHSDYVLAMMS